jgi:hypothetical protein
MKRLDEKSSNKRALSKSCKKAIVCNYNKDIKHTSQKGAIMSQEATTLRRFHVKAVWLGSNKTIADVYSTFLYDVYDGPESAVTGGFVGRVINDISRATQIEEFELKLTSTESGSTDLNNWWPIYKLGGFSNMIAAKNAWILLLHKSSATSTGAVVFATRRSPADLAVSALEKLHSRNVLYEYNTFTPRIKSNRRVACAACRKSSVCFKVVPHELKSDKQFVLQVVSRNAYCLEHLDEELRSDKDVVAQAVQYCAQSFVYAAPALAGDKAFVKSLCARDFQVLKYTNIFHDDYDVVDAAVKNNGTALQWASPALRCNDALIFAALKTCNNVASVLSVVPGLHLKDDAFWASVLAINSAVNKPVKETVREIVGPARLQGIQAQMM